MRDVSCASRSKLVPEIWTRETSRPRVLAAARFSGWLLLFGVGYFLTARLSEADLFLRSRIGLLWAPNALLLSALALATRRSWWLILGAASVAHVLALGASTPAWRLAWQIPANAAFVIATTEALRHFIGFPIRFESRREVLIYLGLILVMPVSVALMSPGFVLSVSGVETWFTPGIEFLRLMLANITPALLVAPAVLLSAGLEREPLKGVSKGRIAEGALIMGAMAMVSVLVFCSPAVIGRLPWLVILVYPPLVWAAVRLGPIGASLCLFCVWGLSIVGSAYDLGPFVVNANDDVVFSLQLFWIATSAPVLLLAAVIRERENGAKASDELRREVAQFAQAAVVAELSRALGNELSQPVTAILANAPAAKLLLARRSIDDEELTATLDDIEYAAGCATQIINEFRRRAKKAGPRIEAIDLPNVVRAALDLSGDLLALTEVQMQTAPGLPSARADRVQLLQVMLDLIANGCDSMRASSVGSRRLCVRVVQPDPRHVEITVADSGVGLPNGEVERVFEPFVTTKREGLGLGLPIARSFALDHGGQLWAENNREGGATFHLVLPIDGPTQPRECTAADGCVG